MVTLTTTERFQVIRTIPAAPLVPLLLMISLTFCPGLAHAEQVAAQVVEADLLLVFGEGLGRAPLAQIGGTLELGTGRYVGLVVGGHAAVASTKALGFLERVATGGGATLAIRLYLRGRWPQGFSVGFVTTVSVIEGVGAVQPRGELAYRWVPIAGLCLRAHLDVGGYYLWDTEDQDARLGPEEGSLSGFLMGAGLSIGWGRGG